MTTPNAIVKVGSVEIGNKKPLSLIAGPCALESRDHALEMLQVIVADLRTPQTGSQQAAKSKGLSDSASVTSDSNESGPVNGRCSATVNVPSTFGKPMSM